MEVTSIGKHKQTLCSDVLHLPGLVLLGHSLSSKASLPMDFHTHEGAMEFVVLVRGNECYCVDGAQYELCGGEAFVSFVDQPHSNGDAPQGVSEFIWFQLEPSPPDLLGLSPLRAEALRKQLLSLGTHLLKADRECLRLLKNSFGAFMKQDDAAWHYAASLFVSFLCRLLFLQRHQAADDLLIKKAIGYIEANIHTDIGMDELSGLCGVSASGFKHKFKECTGETPRDFINHHKIARAKELLRSGQTVTDTAMALSFNSSDYFAVVFKKFTTLTPSQYARQNSK